MSDMSALIDEKFQFEFTAANSNPDQTLQGSHAPSTTNSTAVRRKFGSFLASKMAQKRLGSALGRKSNRLRKIKRNAS